MTITRSRERFTMRIMYVFEYPERFSIRVLPVIRSKKLAMFRWGVFIQTDLSFLFF